MFRTDQASTLRPPRASRRAFTIIELLISIAIIMLLITAALVALSSAKRAASRTESLNALRQMMMAYNAYVGEHDGRLMPGYVDPSMIGTAATQLDLRARLQTGYQLNAADVGSYVWRLAPYLDHAWKTFMVDYRSGGFESRFVDEYGDGTATGRYGPYNLTGNQLGIALRPAFGLNSLYVGGDSIHGDSSLNPWINWPALNTNRIAALRLSEVKNPAKLIVFAPTRAGNAVTLSASPPQGLGTSGVMIGYPVLTPPYANFDRDTQTALLPQWEFNPLSMDLDEILFTGGMGGTDTLGLPFDRLANHNRDSATQKWYRSGEARIPTGRLDGSVVTEMLESLGPNTNNPAVRMSLWSPFALGNQ